MKLFTGVALFSMETPENNASVNIGRKQHELLDYAITNKTVNSLPSSYSKKWEPTEHTCVTLQAFHPFFFSGENIIQSYSKS